VTLQEQATNWPTPGARDFKDTPGMATTGVNPDGSIRDRNDQLARAVHQWSAPATSPSSLLDLTTPKAGAESLPSDQTLPQQWRSPNQRDHHAMGPRENATQRQKTLVDQVQAMAPKAQLNPLFDEWLMGWPLGWTDFAPVGTEWCRWKQRMRSALSRLVSASRSAQKLTF